MNSYLITILDKNTSTKISSSFDIEEKDQYTIFYTLRKILYDLKPNQEVIKIEKVDYDNNGL